MGTKPLLKTLCLCLSVVFLLGTYSEVLAHEQEAVETSQAAGTQNLQWVVSIMESEVTKSISSTKAYVEYGGTINEVAYQDEPQAGYTFLLVMLSVGKQQVGAARFEWKNLFMEDEQGNRYYRHANDTFLELHGIPRMKATTLTIGNNEGFVCFEIPEGTELTTLRLIYDGEGSQQEIPLVMQ